MNRYRAINLAMLCLLALSGSWFLQCGEKVPPPLPNSSEVAAVGPAPDGSIKVNNIIGVKMEHNAQNWDWLPLVILVQVNTNLYQTFSLMVANQDNLLIITDVAANEPCWLKFTKYNNDNCSPGRCSAAKAELHLHSLAELH